jgi:hypothetical protein
MIGGSRRLKENTMETGTIAPEALKAGDTNHAVNVRVRVTHVASTNPGERLGIGAVGRLTHPFAGWPGVTYLAGLYLDEKLHGGTKTMNLCRGDRYEVLGDDEELPINVQVFGATHGFNALVSTHHLRTIEELDTIVKAATAEYGRVRIIVNMIGGTSHEPDA